MTSRNLKKLQSKERKLRVFISMPFTGKVFEELVKERKDLARLVESFGFELLEQFIGYQKKDDFETKDYDPSYILAKDKHYIKQSDVVIADFTALSIGTACEVTIAKELFDKKVYAVVPKERRKHSWLKFYCDYFFDSVEDALKQIKKDFEGKINSLHIHKTQYDAIAVEYRLVENTLAQKYVYDYEISNFIKENGRGKKVVVLHAGSGYRARLAKEYGAREVVGIDLSHKQIQIAREEEMKNPQGIIYHIIDPCDGDFLNSLPKELLGKADIVLGFFLLDHAMNRDDLKKVVNHISALLKPGGLFFGMLDHPDASSFSDSIYGVEISAEGNAKIEGSPRRISIYQNGLEVLHFHNFVWKTQTIKEIFEKLKFSQLTFRNARVSSKGIEEKGKDFWKRYQDHPDQLVFWAKKKI